MTLFCELTRGPNRSDVRITLIMHLIVTSLYLCTQVVLNDDYEGGELTYLLSEGVRCPKRPAGSATVHGGALGQTVHAVTQLRGGVRYGLFLLKKDNISWIYNRCDRL